MHTLRDLSLSGRRVFMRVDFNVPIKDGVIGDDTRIRSAVPTIQLAIARGATVILASHLGRPKGTPNPQFTLQPVATHLAGLLGRPVAFAPDCIGDAAATVIAANPGGVVLLENLRFYKEEEGNDATFARALAALADVYVNDAFGAAHRAHASTEGITHHVKEKAAGLLMEAEVTYLGKALHHPDRPFVAILGGAKVSDKLEVIQNLLGKVDALLIGGAMAYTFLTARGIATGTSLVEADLIDTAKRLDALAQERGVRLELPIDHVVAPAFAADAPTRTIDIDSPSLPTNGNIGTDMGLDIGPKTVAHYREIIAAAKTVVWNGPMGVFEMPAFAAGTMGVAQAVANVSGTTIIGGGDSVAAVAQAGVADRMTHISTGGGASLEFLGGRTLPGVAALA
ncbi:MAG: phosphoglycerate kinase [Acidimicrobiia bacterium]|nr:phosphoglycerate kinase [Acidimicrobiia bacterium]